MKILKNTILLSFAFLLLGTPAISFAQEQTTMGIEVSEIKMTISGSNVRILNAAQSTLNIYNITGLPIASYRIDSADKTFSLNLPKGCYILKVNRIVRKLSLL
ncbi:MAG: T9SS type A sorting domain-containing protein [Bacteroidaceae bacterium]